MKLALIQQPVSTDLEDNVKRGLTTLETAAGHGVDLVVYPELAFTPFYPQHKANPDVLSLAEPIPGPTVIAFQKAAKRLGVVVVLNLYERDGPLAYDTSPVIDADGTLLGFYRKSHILQDPGFEEKFYFTPGDSGWPVCKTKFGKLGVLICWDQWYP